MEGLLCRRCGRSAREIALDKINWQGFAGPETGEITLSAEANQPIDPAKGRERNSSSADRSGQRPNRA
jgi:hypothetical protein